MSLSASSPRPVKLTGTVSGAQKGLPFYQLAPLRERIGCLTKGGLTGVPQVNLPRVTAGGAPIGLSIIGARGSDLDLLLVVLAFEQQAA
jgi:amidase